jgi:hypothetical protein
MRLYLLLIGAGFASAWLSGCTSSASPPPAAASPEVTRPNLLSRDLAPAEKTALTHSLSKTLKDPDSAKFDWGPVKYVQGSASTEYCGIVNAKNSYGGYTGYQMYHAIISLDPKGHYTSGSIDMTMPDNATGDQLKTNVEYEEKSIAAGYGQVSLTPQ